MELNYVEGTHRFRFVGVITDDFSGAGLEAARVFALTHVSSDFRDFDYTVYEWGFEFSCELS